MVRLRRDFGGEQIAFHLLERRNELPLRAWGDAARRLGQSVGRSRVHLLEDRLRLRRQIELHGPAIGRMRAPLHPARALHAIDEPGQRDRLDLEALGKGRLRHALAAR